MLYNNVKQTFYTSAEDDRGTSKYFVYENGIIRAKTAANELHIRPGKNIAFVGNSDAALLLKSGIKDVTVSSEGIIKITTKADDKIDALKTQDSTHNTPIDFFDDKSKLHVGHGIVDKFESGKTKITESEIDLLVKKYVDPSDNKITGKMENQPIK